MKLLPQLINGCDPFFRRFAQPVFQIIRNHTFIIYIFYSENFLYHLSIFDQSLYIVEYKAGITGITIADRRSISIQALSLMSCYVLL